VVPDQWHFHSLSAAHRVACKGWWKGHLQCMLVQLTDSVKHAAWPLALFIHTTVFTESVILHSKLNFQSNFEE
jgi:hypothetical protein